MKRILSRKSLALLLSFAILMCSLTVISVSAKSESEEASVEIVSNNVYHGETLKLMYAVKAENLKDGDIIKLYIYDDENNVIDIVTSYEEEVVHNENCYIFTSTRGVPEQAIAEVMYAKAVVVNGDDTVCESALSSYSVLEYLYERLLVSSTKGLVTDDQKELYKQLLIYAELCQKTIAGAAEEDLISNYSYVRIENGTLDGTDNAAMFKKGERITTFAKSENIAEGKSVLWNVNSYDLDANVIETQTVSDIYVKGSGYEVTADSVIITPSAISVSHGTTEELTASSSDVDLSTYGGTVYDWLRTRCYTDSGYIENDRKMSANLISDPVFTPEKNVFDDYSIAFTWNNGTQVTQRTSDVVNSLTKQSGVLATSNKVELHSIEVVLKLTPNMNKIQIWSGYRKGDNVIEITDLYGNVLAKGAEGANSTSTVNIFTTFNVSVDSDTYVKVKISGVGFNVSLAAISLAGEVKQPTITVGNATTTELSANDADVDLSTYGGNVYDWLRTTYYLSDTNTYNDFEGKNGADFISTPTYNPGMGRFFDYKIAFTWNDGTQVAQRNADVVNALAANRQCGYNTSGTNGTIEIVVKLTSDIKKLQIWSGFYKSTNLIQIVDLEGNVLATGAEYNTTYSSSVNILTTFDVDVEAETYVKIRISGTGNNVSLAALSLVGN